MSMRCNHTVVAEKRTMLMCTNFDRKCAMLKIVFPFLVFHAYMLVLAFQHDESAGFGPPCRCTLFLLFRVIARMSRHHFLNA